MQRDTVTGLTSEAIKAQARAGGFDLCGVARAERHPRLARIADWIANGRAGEMTYLADSLDERLDPARVLPTVRSVISVAVVYNTTERRAAPPDGDERAVISRYAWGDDYHDVMRSRLTALLTWMSETAGPGLEAFSCVDNGPVQERVFAEQAGLGWIGKHTCVINPELGSWLFLGEILTNAELDPDEPAIDQCGTCTRCLKACPTGAIVEPYQVDATRCLSYLTIETRGEVEESLRKEIGEQIYGCDICQDVCPWNRKAATSDDFVWQPRAPLGSAGLLELCRLTDNTWRMLMQTSAMRRAGLRRIRRTLAYAAGNAPAPVTHAALDALRTHPSSEFPEVASAIQWAGRGKERGFTLIELMIVVAIISIITALASAGLMRSRGAANESSAIASLRVTFSSQQAYSVACGRGAYATSYLVLGTPLGVGDAGFISPDLGGSMSPMKSGYQFNLVAGAGAVAGPNDCSGNATTTAFYATAVPLSVYSGGRSFATNGSGGAVWQNPGGSAPTEPFGAPATPIQ